MKEDNNQLTVYLHSQDGKYLGVHILDSSHQDPLGNHNIPHGAVAVEPPVPREGFDIYWTGTEWEYRAVPQEPEPELPTLEELKQQKLQQISSWKNQAIFGGFESDAKGTAMAYDSEVDAQLNLHTLYVVSNSPDFATNPAYNGVVKVPAALVSEPANGKSNVAHSATEVENVIVDLAGHRDACNEREAALQEQVRLAETIEELDEIQWEEPEPVPPVPVVYKTMGVVVDENSSPYGTVSAYVGDAVGMTAGSDEWDSFFKCKPCAFKNGQVLGYLDPMNFKKYVDGTDAPLTGDGGADVMIEFPRMGIKIDRNNKIYTVLVTDNPNDPDFTYFAHTRGTVAKDYFYFGAYEGTNVNEKLRSQPNLQVPVVSKLVSEYRNMAKSLGSGYGITAFYQITFLQCLYLLKHARIDSSTALGHGYIGGIPFPPAGATFDKGFNYIPNNTTSDRSKFLGIEDMIGNANEVIDGVMINSASKLLTSIDVDNFNDAGTAYIDRGAAVISSRNVYVAQVEATVEKGFVIKTTSTTSSPPAFYGDDYRGVVNSFGTFGTNAGGGMFSLYLAQPANSYSVTLSARLMYI